jgi:hypothetical protein
VMDDFTGEVVQPSILCVVSAAEDDPPLRCEFRSGETPSPQS